MPSDAKFSLKSSKFLEGLGKKVFPIQAGGIILVEVSKQTAAAQKVTNKLKMKVYHAGELVPGLESLDAVRSGAAQASYGAPYYWTNLSDAI